MKEERQPLKVLVVDDSVVYRRILSGVVEELNGVALAGTAANGKIALDKLRKGDVDLVLLDLEMPEMDGLSALDAINRDHPEVDVIMISGANRHAADVTVEALERGAVEFIPKPSGSNADESRDELRSRLQPLVHLCATRAALGKARRTPSPADRRATGEKPIRPARETIGASSDLSPAIPSTRVGEVGIVAIGSSTGGPAALASVIPQLPADIGVPIVVVQHMPPVFTKSLAEGLDRRSALAVREAQEGDVLEANTVLIAPGGRHMVVRGSHPGRAPVIGLNDQPPENSCRPAVDVLFRSVAPVYSGRMLSVVLTGMGADGRNGVQVMKRRGCYCLTQSEGSCVIYGMPRAVDEAGLSDESVDLDQIAERITRFVRGNARRRSA